MGAGEEVFKINTHHHENGKTSASPLFSPSSGSSLPRALLNPEGDRLAQPLSPSKVAPEIHGGKPSLLRRPCMYLTRFVKCVPVIFICCVVCWSYYAYVVALVLNVMTNTTEQTVCLVIFHAAALFFLWSYYMCVVTHPGKVPPAWHLAMEDVERLGAARSEEEWKSILASLASQLGCQVRQRSVQNAVRYCEKCLAIKPDRSHHCSVCEECTLKMDHHCPWVNNCVGFLNYKFFILFLLYALCYCVTIASTTARHFFNLWLTGGGSEESGAEDQEEVGSAKYHILLVFFVSIMFSLSISSLFSYHIWLLFHNRSTLEQFRAPSFDNQTSDPNGWSLGKLGNLREVMGDSPWLWLFPVPTTLGDGLRFPTRIGCDTGGGYQSLGRLEAGLVAETPSRTLINPVIGGQTDQLNPAAVTEVRLDTNGHAQTVKLSDNFTEG